MNTALRAARGGLSRQQLAELVNAYLWDRYAQRVELDGHYVAKLERGVIRWPNRRYREAFRAVLHACADEELGFHTARSPAPPSIKATDWDVTQINSFARTLVAEQHRYGGWWLRDAALAQMRWAASLLSSGADVRAAVGYLAYVCAFMCFDTSAPSQARRLFTLGLRCAEGDWSFRATVLSAMSRQSTWLGRPDDGLTLAEQALVRADRLSAVQRAMLFAARARSLAALGRVQDALRDVGRADDEFARAEPGLEPPATRFYDHRQHLGDTGEALAGLVGHRHGANEAERRLRFSVDRCSDTHARSKLLAQVKLATLTVATGDPAEAALLATAAMKASGAVRSDRVTEEFRRLAVSARKHRTVSGVPELLAQIGR